MHEIPILTDLLLLFGLAIPVIYVCHKLHVPGLVGLLLTGILIGPNALALIEGQHEVEVLAEIGIILLLFVIGLEFSLEKLSRIKDVILVGGTVQVLGAIGLTAAILSRVGFPLNEAIFVGFLVSLSSTAIVLKMMQERGELTTPEGQSQLGILIYQDVAIVPLMLLTPFLAGQEQNLLREFTVLLGAALVTGLLVVVLARYVVPPLLYGITSTRQQDLFLLSVVFLGLLVCWFTARVGLSLSLGAFMAGLIISESEYSHEAISHVIPFRDVFTSLFFVSMGILVDPTIFLRSPGFILLLTAGAMLIGTLTAGGAILLYGYPVRTAILVGVGLNQVGEFSLILSKVGLEHGIISMDHYQLFLSVALLSMMMTPFEYRLIHRVKERFSRLNLYEWMGLSGVATAQPGIPEEPLRDHLIVVGFGPTGEGLVRAAEQAEIPHVISELNPNVVYDQQRAGRPIHYGNAGSEPVLEQLGVRTARVLALTMSDPSAKRRIVQRARLMNPNLYIVARARFPAERDALEQLGADEVLSEELEVGRTLLARVLQKYMVPEQTIERTLRQFQDGFGGPGSSAGNVGTLLSRSTDNLLSLRVEEGAPLANQTLAESALRSRWEVTVLAVRREGTLHPSPDPSTRLREGDDLIVIGEPENLRTFREEAVGGF